MKTEHSNESPFQKGDKKKDFGSLELDVREYSVIQVALHQLIEGIERQIAAFHAGDARLLAMGFTHANLEATQRILAGAKSAFHKLELNGIGLSREQLKNWESAAGEEILERLNKKLND